ncbi:hypothetical protein LTS08_001774 [Lithohypha guttulata]|nr:hypothetical protein LTS08_001774 [Lithohypha guttulata]
MPLIQQAGLPHSTPQMASIYPSYQNSQRRKIRRSFNPEFSKRYGRATFPPEKLVKYSPRWGYARLFNFPYPGSSFRPRMNTIVVQVHGVAIPNSRTDPTGRAGAGIYFGRDDCPHNMNFALQPYVVQTANRAILEAVRTALSELISMRHTKLDPRWKEVLIMTNNDYVKQSLDKWVWEWEHNGWQRMGRLDNIKNLETMKEVHNLLTYIETMLNMAVRFWKVDRKDIFGADRLATQALSLLP